MPPSGKRAAYRRADDDREDAVAAAVAAHLERAMAALVVAEVPERTRSAVAAEHADALSLVASLENESNRGADALLEALRELEDLEGRT